MSALGSCAYLFTLTPTDLDLSDRLEHPSNLYDAALDELFDALERTFSGPCYAVAENGKGSAPGRRGRLHVHVIAHRADGPQHVRRDTERCKPVTDAPGLYRYLAKAPEPYSLEAHLDLSAARVTGRPPRTRRHFLGPSRLAWAELNALTQTLPPSPSNRGGKPAQRESKPTHPSRSTNAPEPPEPDTLDLNPTAPHRAPEVQPEREYEALPAPRAQQVKARHSTRPGLHKETSNRTHPWRKPDAPRPDPRALFAPPAPLHQPQRPENAAHASLRDFQRPPPHRPP